MSNGIRPVTRVARGATYVFVQSILSNLLGTIYLVVLLWAIPPPPEHPDMGIYAILTIIQTLIAVFGAFALGTASTKYIAQYVAEGQPEKARSVVTRVLQIDLVTSGVLTLVLFLLSGFFSVMLNVPTWASLFQILALSSFLTVLRPHIAGFLQGLQKIREVAFLNLLYEIVQKSSSIYMLYAGLGLFSVVYGWLIGLAAFSLAGLILTQKFLGIIEKPHPIRPLMGFSSPLYVSNILGFFSGYTDQFLTLPFLGVAILGFYHVAARAAVIAGLISTSIITALFPQLSELHTRGGKDALARAFRVSTRSVLVSFPVILGLVAVAKPVFLLVNADYLPAVAPLIVICFSALVGAVGVAVHPTLLTLERTKTVLGLSVISIMINTFASYSSLAYLNLGMTGPAWARIFSTLASVGLGAYVLKKTLDATFDKEALWKGLTASVLMVTVVMLVEELIFDANMLLYLLLFYIAVGIIVYFVSLIALKTIKKSDIERVRDYLPGKFKGLASWLDRFAVPD